MTPIPSMRAVVRAALVLLPAIAAASCGMMHHDHMFPLDRPFEPMKSHPLQGRRVALELSRVPETLDTSANGHTFRIRGIRPYVARMLTTGFGADGVVADAAAADDVVTVELHLRMSAALFGASATANATCRIFDAKGTLLAEGKGEHEASFPTMANGGNNCELATLIAVPKALDAAMAKLPPAPAPAPAPAGTP